MSKPNFTGVAQRQLLVTAIDVSNSGYNIIGRRVADSSISFGTTVTTETDILGMTETTVNSMNESQTFSIPVNDDYEITGWMLDVYRRRAFNEFTGLKVLQIHAFEGAAGSYEAIEFDSCTIEPTDFGGSGTDGRINLSFTLHYGGQVRRGTVNTASLGTPISFTAA